MSRSGYSDDGENLELWRANIGRATSGRRGQAFFAALVKALDDMPVKRLASGELETTDGEVCALGSLGKARGAKLEPDDTYDYDKLGATFDIAPMLAQEVMYENDEGGPIAWPRKNETPEERWSRIRKWANEQIAAPTTPAQETPGDKETTDGGK